MNRVSLRAASLAFFVALAAVAPTRADVGPAPIPGGDAALTAGHGPYKDNRELSDAYLAGVADGFALGIRGAAAQLVGPQSELTAKAARLNGFVAGYSHGRRLFQFMTGEKGYRNPK